MEITKTMSVTIQVSDIDAKKCSPLCSQYDCTDYDGDKYEYCAMYAEDDTSGYRCKQCLKDFGV